MWIVLREYIAYYVCIRVRCTARLSPPIRPKPPSVERTGLIQFKTYIIISSAEFVLAVECTPVGVVKRNGSFTSTDHNSSYNLINYNLKLVIFTLSYENVLGRFGKIWRGLGPQDHFQFSPMLKI